jgi:hypothetical protein
MNSRTAKFRSTIFVGVAAGVALTATAFSAAHAAECLSGPKGAAPQGSHWFYRIDHATKRNCWYVREAGAKPAQPTTTASAATVSAQPAPPKSNPSAPLQPSVANARAELMPAPANDDPNAIANQPAATLLPNSSANDQPQGAEPQPATTGNWSMSSRWSDRSTGTDASTDAAQPMAAQEAPPAAIAADTAVPAAVAAPSQGGSIWTLIGALAAALAFAGALAGAIIKFGSRPKPAIRRDAFGRRDIWGDAAERASALPADVEEHAAPPLNWIKIARERQATLSRSDEIEELLARAPRGQA